MTSFSNCDVLFPNCDELFPNCDELFLIVTSYSVCDFYRETEIINKNHVIIVKAHTNTTLNEIRYNLEISAFLSAVESKFSLIIMTTSQK